MNYTIEEIRNSVYYKEGEKARKEGRLITSNPWSTGSYNTFRLWKMGYLGL